MNIRKLCKLIIRQSDSPQLKNQLRDAALFEIEPTILGGKVKVPDKLLLDNQIQFPFYNIFFQYPVFEPNYFTSISLFKDPDNGLLYYAYFVVLNSKFICFAQGEITYKFISKTEMAVHNENHICGVRGNNQWVDYEKLDYKKYTDAMNDLKDHIHYAFRYLLMINNRDLFIIEQKIKSRNTKYKMRSVFSILHPRIIREKIAANNNYKGGNAQPLLIGQERRGHWRIYKHSRYSATRRSEPQKIEPYWAGPKSFTDPKDPNKHYQVRLDL